MNRFDRLSFDIKCALEFNEWIMWSIKCEEIETNYYDKYKHFRNWCVDKICEHNILYSEIPSVNDQNQNDVFKKARKNLDIKAIAKVDTHEFNFALDNSGLYVPEIDKLN